MPIAITVPKLNHSHQYTYRETDRDGQATKRDKDTYISFVWLRKQKFDYFSITVEKIGECNDFTKKRTLQSRQI